MGDVELGSVVEEQVSNWETRNPEGVQCNICGVLTEKSNEIESSLITLLNSSVLKIELNSSWTTFCKNCCKTLKDAYEIEAQMRLLSSQLSQIQEQLLTKVIQQCVNKCIKLGFNGKCVRSQEKVKSTVTESVKRLGVSSTGYRIYKKWRSRFTKAFVAQINASMETVSELNNESSQAIEPVLSKMEAHIGHDDALQIRFDHDYLGEFGDLGDCKSTRISEIEDTGVQTPAVTNIKYTCPTCNQEFNRKVSLEAHIEKHHQPNSSNCRKSICPICNVAYENSEILKLHLKEIHTRSKCQRCDSCFEFFILSLNGTVHAQDHKCKPYSRLCTCCGSKFLTKSHYEEHIKYIDKSEQIERKGQNSRAKKQGQVLRTNKHNRQPAGQRRKFRQHLCDICKKVFITRTELSIHSRVHSGEKPVMCETCGQRFSSLSSLHSHRRTHAGIRPFKCFKCTKSFRSAGHLSKHEIIHTGVKPFICSICKKSFNRRENLKTHQLTHNKVRPFQCPQCSSVSYSRANLLKNHMIERHGASSNTSQNSVEASNPK